MSDPHLGKVSPGQELDDEKVEFTGQPDLETTQKVFKRTLDRLAGVVAKHGKPDVAVVSGDLTYRTGPTGFDDFIKLLEEHEDVLPDRGRIVVVPGNHDVLWKEKPGTKARYAPFLRATRDQGCITPLLDGVDFAADDERGRLFADVETERHVVETDDMLAVPLNTSNWCGEFVDPRWGWKRPDWEKALAPLGGGYDVAIERIDQLRQQDIARVSRPQLAAVGKLFDALKLSRTPGDDVRVRVVVMHHQLLPVSAREERKPFESLLNLGEVRQMLAEYGFDLVLHGHKHQSSLYWDTPSTDNEDLAARVQRMLVIASPGHFGAADPTMRALIFEGNRRARNLRVRTYLGAASSTRKLKSTEDQVVPLWDGQMAAETTERTVISATTPHVAYARLRAHFEGREDRQVRNLVCRVDDPGGALFLPPDHPAQEFDDPQRWFVELVAWWQQERSELVERRLIEFNHGERIRRRWGNQVERAIHQLNSRENSSRSLIVLIDPKETGRRANDPRRLAEGGTYPAFALAEFSIRRIARNRRALDCFAYFRKQEMQYWWPVNFAEVALLQNAVLGGLKGSPARGRIVTFSAIALWKDVLPRVAVPEVTRLIEQPERLWSLASALAFPATATDEVRADWRALLDDLVADRDDPLLSRPGVETLREELVRFQALPETAALDDGVTGIDGLLEAYDLIGTQNPLTKQQRARLDERYEALRDALQALLER
jgi:3',5'-cyclic AMP phosphodiesterase CpdA/thymidylate synthase